MTQEQNLERQAAIEDKHRLLGRVQRFHQDQKGQIMVMSALMALVFVLFWTTLFGVGEAVGMRMKLQDVADTQAYTEAIWGARCLNWIAWVNRGQVANLIICTQFTIIHSHAKFWFDWVAMLQLVLSILGKIPIIGAFFTALGNISGAILGNVVAAYELFAFYLADIGIPIYAFLIKVFSYYQYAWIALIIWFPKQGDRVMEEALGGKMVKDPTNGVEVDVYEENKWGGIGALGSAFSKTGADAGDTLTQALSAAGKLALTFYSYYKYYALLRPLDGPTGIDDDSRFTRPQSGQQIKMWKRFKWMTENTATRGWSPGGKSANDHPVWKWIGRGGDLNEEWGVDLGVLGLKAGVRAGGDTHALRYSGKDGGPHHKMAGQRFKMICGLWKWHESDFSEGNKYDGYKKWDGFAHDYFDFYIKFKLFFTGWFTIFDIGVHEAEIVSETIDPGDEDSGGDENPMGNAAQKLEEEAAKAAAARAAAGKIKTAYSQWTSEATDLANEKDGDGNYVRDPSNPDRAAVRDSILSGASTSSYDNQVFRNGGDGEGVTGVGNLGDYDEMSAGAPQPSGYTHFDGLLGYPAWRWGSAADAKAYADLLETKAAEAEDSANEAREQVNEMEQKLDEIAQGISGALYGDRPVLLWWEIFWNLDNLSFVVVPKHDDEAEERWDEADRKKMTWWELDSTVEEDEAKRHNYKWTTDARKISHISYLTMPYEFGLKNFGLGQWLFAAKDTKDENRMFDGRGFNVLGRAECVYINPNQRDQWPNVFNPYWRSRLAPLSYEVTNLLEKIDAFKDIGSSTSGLGASFNTLFRQIFTH